MGLFPEYAIERKAKEIMRTMGQVEEVALTKRRLGKLAFMGEWVIPPELELGSPRKRRGWWHKLGRFLGKALPVLGGIAGVALVGKPAGMALAKLSDILRKSPAALSTAGKTLFAALGLSKAQEKAGNLAAAEKYGTVAKNLMQAMQTLPPQMRQQALQQGYQATLASAARYGQHHTTDLLIREGMMTIAPPQKVPWMWLAIGIGGAAIATILAITLSKR